MVLTNEQIEERISSEDNLTNQIEQFKKSDSPIIERKSHAPNPNGRNGNSKSRKNLTDDERVAVGVLSNTVGEDVAAEIFDVSKDHAHHLRSANRSLTPGQGFKDTELQVKIDERLAKVRTTIQEQAAEKLLGAFDLLDDEKLQNCSARELSTISKDMSQTMRNMEPKVPKESGNGGGVKIIIQQPKPTTEEHFDFVEIQATG